MHILEESLNISNKKNYKIKSITIKRGSMVEIQYVAGSVFALTTLNSIQYLYGSPYFLQQYLLGVLVMGLFLAWIITKIDKIPTLAAIIAALVGGLSALFGYVSLSKLQLLPVILSFVNIVVALILIKYSLTKVAYEI